MKLQIGDREFDTGRMKAKTFRTLLGLFDAAEKARNAVVAFDKTIEFYVEVLKVAGYEDVTVEWLAENLDAYQVTLPYMASELLPQMMERPKNGLEREATEKDSPPEGSLTSAP